MRNERGLSQLQIADSLGVSRQTINSIENHRYLPSLPLAFALGAFFELKIDEIFSNEEEKA